MEYDLEKLIGELQRLLAKHGNLPVWTSHEWTEPVTTVGYLPAQHAQHDELPERIEVY